MGFRAATLAEVKNARTVVSRSRCNCSICSCIGRISRRGDVFVEDVVDTGSQSGTNSEYCLPSCGSWSGQTLSPP